MGLGIEYSMAKLCLLFMASLSLHLGLTPPTRPPPTKNQFIPDKGSARTSEMLLRWLLSTPTSYYKMLLWLTLAFQIVTTLSFAYPQSSTFYLIRSYLVFPGHTGQGMTDSPRPIFIISTILVVLGGTIRLNCFRALGSSFTFELSFVEGQKLIKSGPYSIVRHPSYTGAILSLTPTIVIHLSPGSWVRESGILDTIWGKVVALVWFGGMAIMAYTVVVRIDSEEKILEKKFGQDWTDYKKAVPYKLFPGIF
ncbi:hypothetical protein K435DRAFT_966183 [Dendrothele bispora CBS 962.96]|uniref:Protein-S-isoprenylcysteine O-methyltransferase n=1 Tax=Dendrothele bispora (strain CBS 962.96) TaxID=1314807 RepID=A0A4S8M1I7_DENBC|nr:hypothetical protein K435DRAFT_966183 [Dendrothele bispora CBS 962.96]